MIGHRRWRIWMLPLIVLILLGGGMIAAGWSWNWLGVFPARTLFLIVLVAVINALIFVAVLAFRDGISATRLERERCQRELRYFCTLGGAEGRLRIQGLVRDLNAMGGVPADLEGALLTGIDLSGANLAGTNLKGAELQGANLQGANLRGADLFGAVLNHANLSMADLANANLRGSALSEGNLVKADLRGANLHRADLVDTNVEGVDFTQVRLDRARFARRTRDDLPQNIHPSVEDWIRERLDPQGVYRDGQAPGPGQKKGTS